jgi:hypothetical protein
VNTENPVLREFAEELDRSLSDALVAVVQYGPSCGGLAASAAWKGSVNLLILCRSVVPSTVKAIRAPLARARKKLDLVPVLFSREEFLSSLDVFPVEASEIRRQYRLLLGEDVVADGLVTMKHLRHQLEFELRSKKLLLLSHLMREDESATVVGQTVMAFHESLVNLGRYYLALKGKDVVADDAALTGLLAADPGIPAELLARLAEIAGGKRRPSAEEKPRLVWDFLQAVDRLTEAADKLDTPQ